MSKLKKPNIFTIPACRPFLKSLAKTLLEGNLPALGGVKPNPVDLTEITLYLPSRRLVRALQEAFLQEGGGRAMLLPKIFPIFEGEEDLSLIMNAASEQLDFHIELAPPITEIHRRLELSRLIHLWSKSETTSNAQCEHDFKFHTAYGARTPAQTVTFAIELARILDSIETYGLNFEMLKDLVPDVYSQHWEKTLKLLQVLTLEWPKCLSSKKLLSQVTRRKLLIHAESQRLKNFPPYGPVIVAGITNSTPDTEELMKTVLHLANGAIVLPCVDLNLDFKSWDRIQEHHPEHPQYSLCKLLTSLGLKRSDIVELPGEEDIKLRRREIFFSEVLRPSSTTDLWHTYIKQNITKNLLEDSLSNLNLVEAPTEQDEAEAISLILREAAEIPNQTAALVTPDRLLARRVAIRLQSWGIRIDDSAGKPFSKTVPGTFLELILSAYDENFSPVHLMSLLKHPLTRLGLDPHTVRLSARILEITAFRRPYFGVGFDGILSALQQSYDEHHLNGSKQRRIKSFKDEDWKSAIVLVENLKTAFLPLINLSKLKKEVSLYEIVRAHLIVAENLSTFVPSSSPREAEEPSLLWQGEAGDVAKALFQELLDEKLPDIRIEADEYADLYRSLILGINVRPLIPPHPRLFIWGPVEARFQHSDTIILASLNEGTWPASHDAGPWLNRGMLKDLGLPPPEEKIGLAALDFVSLVGAKKIIITRSEKIDGVPTVPSRWLNRLLALIDGLGSRDIISTNSPWLDWASQRNKITSKIKKIECPKPKPDVKLRPRKLSVSQIETFLSNPYAIFAKEILKLDPLQKLGPEPDAALRGRIIHEILSHFTRLYPQELPKEICQCLSTIARDMLEKFHAHPRVSAFWLPRFLKFAEWFANTEPQRRANINKVLPEINGSLVFHTSAGDFTLTARADRIDVGSSEIVITDYKTGILPNNVRVLEGVSPQLPLEAAIALQSGFPNITAQKVSALRYIRVIGGQPAGEEFDIKCDNIFSLASETLEGLKRYINYFDNPNTPYQPLRRYPFSYKFDDYSHLARISEWSTSDDEKREGAE